ncbi:MAG: hypothetical protein AAF722_12125 [Cyanobacteria bacterium P01_C01_bin.70]
MKRPWTFQILFPLVMLVLLAVSCDRLLRQWNSDDEQPASQPVEEETAPAETAPAEIAGTQTLNTTDSGQNLVNNAIGIQVTLPNSWSETSGLHESAELQAVDSGQDLYLIVLAEDAPALNRLGLRENAENYRSLLRSQLAVDDGEAPTEVAFVDDEFASQSEIRGRLADDTPVVYLHTTVVTEERYYQIVMWATPEQYQTYRSELQNITATFREIGS